MSDEGRRIEFEGPGPYLFQTLDMEPQATLLKEHDVCLLQFGQLYFPIAMSACPEIAAALSDMSQSAAEPEKEGMTPLEFDFDTVTELPLVTGAKGGSRQHDETIFLDVMFGEAEARLRFSILTAAAVGQFLSLVEVDA